MGKDKLSNKDKKITAIHEVLLHECNVRISSLRDQAAKLILDEIERIDSEPDQTEPLPY